MNEANPLRQSTLVSEASIGTKGITCWHLSRRNGATTTASSINIKDVSFPVAMHQESTNYEVASISRSISCDVKGELKSFHQEPSSQSRAPSQWDIFYDVNIHFLVEPQLSNSAYSVSVVNPAQSSFDTDARWARSNSLESLNSYLGGQRSQ